MSQQPLAPFPVGALSGLDPTKASGSRRAYLAENGKEGTYWLKIDALKIFQTKQTNQTMAAADYTCVKVVSALNPQTAHREGEELGHGVKKTVHNFFSDFVSKVCWALLAEQFAKPYSEGGCNATRLQDVPPSGINPANGQPMRGPMEVAAEYVFGPEQPFTNTVFEVRVFRKPQKDPNSPVYHEAEIKCVVDPEVLQDQLSDAMKAKFPAGMFTMSGHATAPAYAPPAQVAATVPQQPAFQPPVAQPQAPAAPAYAPPAAAAPAYAPQPPAAPSAPSTFRFGKK